MADQKGQSAAEAAASQVRAILEAAEQSAAAIRAEAEREANAKREAVERVEERARELERRLDELRAAIHDGVAALKDEVEALRESAAVPAPEEDPGTRIDPAADDELIAEVEATAAPKPDARGRAAKAPDAAAEAAAPADPSVPEGARLLALKMALDGRPREETATYLRENFELADPEALLDEVYARAAR
jgi:gas vesicle protein